jgi:hypothetical protein
VIGRKLALGMAAVALCVTMLPTAAHAKACPALCKDQIKNCKQTTCASLKGKAKKQCIHTCKSHFVTECKATSSTAKDRTCPSSPSGAFLE